MDRARSSTWWNSHSWLCALHGRTAIAQRCALDYFRLSYRRPSVRHRAFPVVSRSQTDDQELVLVPTSDADLSPDFATRKQRRVNVGVAQVGAQDLHEAGKVSRGNVLRSHGNHVSSGEGTPRSPSIFKLQSASSFAGCSIPGFGVSRF